MKLSTRWAATILTGLLFLSSSAATAERILYIPLDDRPVNLDYTVNTFKDAGVDVVTPPESYLSSKNRLGDPDKLQKWLNEEGHFAEAAVVAADSLIYGGLVPSRTHETSETVLSRRTDALVSFKKTHPDVKLYAFSTVMRSPRSSSSPEEPAYYAQWGPKLFTWGALRDKQELGHLTRKEKRELAALEKEIPHSIKQDLLGRRAKNRRVTNVLYDAAEKGNIDYFLIARDDSAPYSEAHRDARLLQEGRKKSYTVRSFSGTDEMGMILLTRAFFKARGRTPLVHAFYGDGKGGDTVPSYEDGPIRNSYRNHVLALGGYPASMAKRADLIVGIYTPYEGITYGADTPHNTADLTEPCRHFLDATANWLKKGYPVGIADIAFGNGSSDALVKGLFNYTLPNRSRPMAWEIASYAGWNTASNSLGYTLGQGLMAPYMTENAKDGLLTIRYLDDWAYQAHVRQNLRYNLTYPKEWPEGKFSKEQMDEIQHHLDSEMKQTADPVMGQGTAEAYQYRLPWKRTFEVGIRKK